VTSIRCSACLNICPVYARTGGHAYGSVYPGPIGAILTPQLLGLERGKTLPYASSLCGACYEVCPVKINIPEVLLHLRGQVGASTGQWNPEAVAMRRLAAIFASPTRYERAQCLGRLAQRVFVHDGVIDHLPGALAGWSQARDLQPAPKSEVVVGAAASSEGTLSTSNFLRRAAAQRECSARLCAIWKSQVATFASPR
jgi:L-lactate dehydrogenase complex protein LldF